MVYSFKLFEFPDITTVFDFFTDQTDIFHYYLDRLSSDTEPNPRIDKKRGIILDMIRNNIHFTYNITLMCEIELYDHDDIFFNQYKFNFDSYVYINILVHVHDKNHALKLKFLLE